MLGANPKARVSKHEVKPTGPSPIFKFCPLCPSCGRQNVVVFSVIAADNSPPDEKSKYVCLGCCPRDRGGS
jgi:hypothetical protein